MSVKQMSSDQLRDDLAAIALTYPDEVPWQQVDRVNALRAELKRRGESVERPAGQRPVPAPQLATMTGEELEAELRKLSTRKDEASQNRFADIRFELRRRAGAPTKLAEQAETSPSVVPRALELPSDEEVERIVPRRPTPAAAKKDPPAKIPTSVCGFSINATKGSLVTISYEDRSDRGSVYLSRALTWPDAIALASMLTDALDD